MQPESSKQIKVAQPRSDKKTPAKPAKTCELRGDEKGSVTGTECRGFKFKGKTYEVTVWNRFVLSLCQVLTSEDKRKLLAIARTLDQRFSTDPATFPKRAFPVKILDSNLYMNKSLHAKEQKSIDLQLLCEFGYEPKDIVFLFARK